jgi:ABC-2 type transport system permease protein
MSLRRAFAIFRKELLHIFRDPRILFLVAVSPVFLLVALSYVFSFDLDRVTFAVLDLDQSPTSRAYVSYLTDDGDFTVKAYAASYQGAEDLLLAGTVNMALVIPRGFGDAVLGRRAGGAEVQLVVDGMDSVAAQKGVGGLKTRTQMFSAQQLGVGLAQAGVDVSSRVWYNPSLKSLFTMVPGLMAVVLFVPSLAVTLALAREKETGSFEGLIATPVRGLEYLAGKLVAYLLTGLIGALLAWLVAIYWFGVPFRGQLVDFVLLTLVYFVATMGIGMCVGNFVASQQTAMVLILLLFFAPSFFLAGLLTPLDPTSLGRQISSSIFPQTHFITITRGLFLKGLGLAGLQQPALWLLGIGGVTLLLSLLLFRKKIS